MATAPTEGRPEAGTPDGSAPFLAPTAAEPIRAAHFGPDRLLRCARRLARTWRPQPGHPTARPLLDRFRDNCAVLAQAHGVISDAYQRRQPLGPDAEWLLDNYHVVADAMREIRVDLPRGYHRELPKLADPPMRGYPRVYALAVGLLAHTDSSLDEAQIVRFVSAYQEISPLSIGELWAVPTMLRLALLENLRRLADQIVAAGRDHEDALTWARRLADTGAASPHLPEVESLMTHGTTVRDPFLVRLLGAVRRHPAAAGWAPQWLDRCLARCNCAADEVVRREHRRQAKNQVTVGNCVTSLRLISALDWTVFFERTSYVEAELRQDPAGVYASQDFLTRDNYRRAVERVSRGSRLGETEVASAAVSLAERASRERNSPNGSGHVGYFLLGDGRLRLEAEVGFRPGAGERARRFVLDHPGAVYFGTIVAFWSLFLALIWAATTSVGWVPALAVVVAAIPASEIAVALVNHAVTRLVPPRVLPKLEFKEGVPPEHATFVVMPTMLLRPDSATTLLERLEVHYLSNGDPGLFFALLTDFADASAATRPEDRVYLQAAIEGVRELNARYAGSGPDRFFLFHRRRIWSAAEGSWMGWERKRGKLLEFNRLLRGARDTSFETVVGDLAALPPVRFVITLDADTQLPRESARRLVGALAHPLNRPRFDPQARRVTAGYGVLQPRISFRPGVRTRSLFARAFVGSAGLDPYSSAVSDVYQDLFGEGSFTGKGIYDIDAFEASAGRAFPPNHILSHDLVEGNYARCALVSDIELLDDFPERYHAYARREHRWARGDWQLLPWLMLRVSVPESGSTAERRARNPLSALGRWKIADNLRRSLLPPALVALLALAWLGLLPGPALAWTGFGAVVIFLPVLLQASRAARDLAAAWGARGEMRQVLSEFGSTVARCLLQATFLADAARILVDAAVRTLYRLTVSRRHLLEWETAASTERRLGASFRGFCREMWVSSAFAAAVGAAIFLTGRGAWDSAAAAPFLVAWLVSPAVAFWVSRPSRPAEPALTDADRRELRRIARLTWAYFEEFVTDDDHALPPDNYQEDPKGETAHRTSPTNVGMYLLSTLAAHDLGYITPGGVAERVGRCLDSLDRLERYRGHFYNWYDTQTLRPLNPRYVSTVDSGNLAASLLALKHGLLEKAEAAAESSEACVAGLGDTITCLDRAVSRLLPPDAAERPPKSEAPVAALAQIEKSRASLRRLASAPPADGTGRAGWLEEIERLAAQLGGAADAVAAAAGEPSASVSRWAARLAALARGRLRDFGGSGATMEAATRDEFRRLAARAEALATGMDFRFLYSEQRHLFATGYNLTVGRLDNSYYDLLASEARLTSFWAIAWGQVAKRHWFQLARPLTDAAGTSVLLSWGGTMFEYLMPHLLLPDYVATLVGESCRGAVDRQIECGSQWRTPWGVSESAYNAFDAALNYQYQSFGVPGLGLKRGLGSERVVAPYATALAARVKPREALENFARLRELGAEGDFGFFEALDFTSARLSDRDRPAVVRCYMAHHQGMTLAALTNLLLGDPMVRRFQAEPAIRATDLLLQERLPRTAPLTATIAEPPPPREPARAEAAVSRRLTSPQTSVPRTHLLSGGRYTVMLTNAGSGFSRCRGVDVTRWREDAALDSWGQFCYIRDMKSGQVWSTGHQPVCRMPDFYEVIFSSDKAEFRRSDGDVDTYLEVAVSPERLAEVRRLTLTNRGSTPLELEVTSYVELALAAHGADLAHPAFGKLFLETEYDQVSGALICRRRPRSEDQQPLFAVHVAAGDGFSQGFETDRAQFIGRNRALAAPAALESGAELSGTVGPVLDPIFSLRRTVRIDPGEAASLSFATAVADRRDEALALADHFRDPASVTRTFELAWAHGSLELDHLGLTTDESQAYQRLASSILYANPAVRAAATKRAANRQGQSGLWAYGISGDLPIVLVPVEGPPGLNAAAQALRAHAFWRAKGLEVDLVLLDEEAGGYLDESRQQLEGTVRAAGVSALLDRPGGVFVRQADRIPEAGRLLLESAARLIIEPGNASAEPAAKSPRARREDRAVRPATEPSRTRPSTVAPGAQTNGASRSSGLAELQFPNGFGGFTQDGREYVVRPPGDTPGQAAPPTPAPWVNVIANPNAGFLISESGGGYTWAGNSQTNRLTPWTNDPVSDPAGEMLFLRDEDTGRFWSPLRKAIGGDATPMARRCRHGFGYTVFECHTSDLRQEVTLFVPPDDPVKIVLVRLANVGARRRHISATFFAEWVLGTTRDQSAANVVVTTDGADGPLIARNPFSLDFGEAVAFADVSVRPRTYSADRIQFLGRNGSPDAPAAMQTPDLSGDVTGAGDPCAAIRATIQIPAGAEADVVFVLGQAPSQAEARRLARHYADPGRARAALQAARDRWSAILGAIRVETPDPAMNVVLNGWLLYQALACRIWARSAFYQSGGAYGFRDQLQDAMALVYGAPDEARRHILRAGSRQFPEGDAQHWWHPPAGRGIRTRFSDDFLWLPFVACHYLEVTGDTGLMDETLSFVEGPPLKPGQDEEYGVPTVTTERTSLYDHCVRALEHGAHDGRHGLPLMGCGDWNDGMNRVGDGGQGESVWVAWFQIATLTRFAAVADTRGDAARAAWCRERAEKLRQAVEQEAWDGGWYRRAYFDDGTPLGSSENSECRIDSIAQSWAVLSGAGDPDRARRAMAAVDDQLVRRDDGLILLFTPPFDDGPLHPGYIKGYVPGIRENGGQYTHAATWVVQAFAELGAGAKAVETFNMLNPVRHGEHAKQVDRYRVEPYVVVADLYGVSPHVGRGGWSWYTGSAAWLYRVGLESILGFRLRGDRLRMEPCIDPAWKGFAITFVHRGTTYRIRVENPHGVERGVRNVTLDNQPVTDGWVNLTDDGQVHDVVVTLGPEE